MDGRVGARKKNGAQIGRFSVARRFLTKPKAKEGV